MKSVAIEVFFSVNWLTFTFYQIYLIQQIFTVFCVQAENILFTWDVFYPLQDQNIFPHWKITPAISFFLFLVFINLDFYI